MALGRLKTFAAAFGTAALLFACAPDPGPFFTPPSIPDDQAAFNQGRLGLLTPVLTRPNELIALRLLSGLQMERENARLGEFAQAGIPFGPQVWTSARAAIPGFTQPVFVDTYRQSNNGGEYVYYENCLSDAFVTAAQTLHDRQKTYAGPELVVGWVRAQDQVFHDCGSAKAQFPDPLPSEAPALARADREYQIAAAHFYAQDLAGAELCFRTIAADAASPWRITANYLIGRTLLREASLEKKPQALAEAQAQFTRIAADNTQPALAHSAGGLLQHIAAVENAQATVTSLSAQWLSRDTKQQALPALLTESTFVLSAPSFEKAIGETVDQAETFDWVRTFENGPARHALDRWQSRGTLPWLIAALAYEDGSSAAVPQLLAEADRLPPDSPAFPTATYNAIRIRLSLGETAALRERLNTLLSATSSDKDPALDNAWRAERIRVASNFDDFLRWAPRTVTQPDDLSKPIQRTLAYDSAYVLNYLTPLTRLGQAAGSRWLPIRAADDVAIAAWTRAVMLNNLERARVFAPLLARTHKDWTPSLTPPSSGDLSEWKFRAALLISLHLQFQPLIPVVASNWQFSDSAWWCPVTPPTSRPDAAQNDESAWIAWKLPAVFIPPSAVLSPREVQTARSEAKQLNAKGSAQSFLAPIVFGWAKTHPEDPRVPQALHRLVVITRYGCSLNDPESGRISKSAFELLHKQYPTSSWTAQTPYWFGPH